MSNITIDTDWGAKGAKLRGSQVQAFIKEEINSLKRGITAAQATADSTKSALEAILPHVQSAIYCRIAYIDCNDKKLKTIVASGWQAKSLDGHFPVGVVIMADGLAPRIVALTGTALPWARNEARVDNSATTPDELYADYNGSLHSQAIKEKGNELFGENRSEWARYASPWCGEYSRVSTIDDVKYGIGAGRWHLPSVGELYLLCKYRAAINICLDAINEAMILPDGKYWSSNEHSLNTWYINTSTGELGVSVHGKTNQLMVRPITTFSALSTSISGSASSGGDIVSSLGGSQITDEFNPMA